MFYLKFFGSIVGFSAFIVAGYFCFWVACALIDQCAQRNGLML